MPRVLTSSQFGGPKTRPLDTSTLLRMPGPCPVPDTEHPERIDWREVVLAIDLTEWRYWHVAIAPSEAGRPVESLVKSYVFPAQLRAILKRLCDAAFDGRKEPGLLDFASPITLSGNFSLDGELAISYHTDRKDQEFGRSLSMHQRLALTQAWTRVARAQGSLKAAS